MQQKVPRCPSCDGVMKPDITFFGEKLPASVKRAVEADYKKVCSRHSGNLISCPGLPSHRATVVTTGIILTNLIEASRGVRYSPPPPSPLSALY